MANSEQTDATAVASDRCAGIQSYADSTPARDPLYIFLCCALWRREANLKAYQEVVAALDDSDPDIRALAGDLLRRSSPRPKRLVNREFQPRPELK